MTTRREGEELVTEGLEISKSELAWIRAQAKKEHERLAGRSKFVPHQGLRERTRRLKRQG
jgi:hypothetical protein